MIVITKQHEGLIWKHTRKLGIKTSTLQYKVSGLCCPFSLPRCPNLPPYFLPNRSKLCSTFTTMYGILNKRPYHNGFVRNSLSKGDFNCGASSQTAIILNYFLSYVPSNFFAFPKFSSNFLSSSQFPPSLVCFSCFSLPWQYVLPMVQKLPVSAKICTYAQEKRSWL